LAESFLGTPYQWGGSTPQGFDCSGLVQYVYKEVGVTLPRRSVDQARSGRASKLGQLARGDLVFFRIDRNVISHVGIYVGNGHFIHAPGTGKYVRRDKLDNSWWQERVMAVRRIL
jgi:cell wall-associated NlpC family hydrolase